MQFIVICDFEYLNKINHISIDTFVGFLVSLKLTQAQVYQQDRYIELKDKDIMNISSIEFPNGYALGSARQTLIRGPPSSRIRVYCRVAIEVKGFLF